VIHGKGVPTTREASAQAAFSDPNPAAVARHGLAARAVLAVEEDCRRGQGGLVKAGRCRLRVRGGL